MKFSSNLNVVYSCKYHVVFCPKYRRSVLVSPIDERLKQIIRETCAEALSELIEMEVMPDHVHLLLNCDPQFGINRLVRSIKGRSSRLLRMECGFR
jgi:putative transposase